MFYNIHAKVAAYIQRNIFSQVLQQSNQNVVGHGSFLPDDLVNEEEFFVYKRRRIDAIAGDGKWRFIYIVYQIYICSSVIFAKDLSLNKESI